MKTFFGIFLFLAIGFSSFSQTWTSQQLKKANTASAVEYLTKVEKDAIQYINLARLYPKLYIKYELLNYFGTSNYGDYLKNSSYRQTLILNLKKMKPTHALVFDKNLYENAKCFAKESGTAGKTGHKRVDCPKENYAECCSYGMITGKDVAMQWLIDHDVQSLGHREICLDGDYTKIGLSVHDHKKWSTCAVAEFI